MEEVQETKKNRRNTKEIPYPASYYSQEEQMDVEEQIEILKRFAQKLSDNMAKIDPEIQAIINDNFWEMYESF